MAGFHCDTCGEYHDELPMCLGAPAPALWYSIADEDRASRAELSSDQCVIDEQYFFILGRILIPVLDGPGPFVWLAWVSLSEENFRRSCELWNAEGRENENAYFGWLQSALPYEPTTLNLKTSLQTMPVDERPLITIEPTNHPLAHEQRKGVSIKRVQELVEATLYGGIGVWQVD